MSCKVEYIQVFCILLTYGNKFAVQIFLLTNLLKHTFECTSSNCEYAINCQQMRELFRHERGCKTKAQGTCETCKKIWSMLQVHARVCKDEECNVHHCRYVLRIICGWLGSKLTHMYVCIICGWLVSKLTHLVEQGIPLRKDNG